MSLNGGSLNRRWTMAVSDGRPCQVDHYGSVVPGSIRRWTIDVVPDSTFSGIRVSPLLLRLVGCCLRCCLRLCLLNRRHRVHSQNFPKLALPLPLSLLRRRSPTPALLHHPEARSFATFPAASPTTTTPSPSKTATTTFFESCTSTPPTRRVLRFSHALRYGSVRGTNIASNWSAVGAGVVWESLSLSAMVAMFGHVSKAFANYGTRS